MSKPSDLVVVADYDPAWPVEFATLAARLRRELGRIALRIDHIGSTAIVGLAAKPIVDVQISVATLDPIAAYRAQLERCGLVWRRDNPDRTKRYFRERPGDRRTHIHVRRAGSWSEQFALLFRDYLRSDRGAADEYAAAKRQLADESGSDRHRYTDAKAPVIWSIIRDADAWAQRTGWEPPSSDA